MAKREIKLLFGSLLGFALLFLVIYLFICFVAADIVSVDSYLLRAYIGIAVLFSLVRVYLD